MCNRPEDRPWEQRSLCGSGGFAFAGRGAVGGRTWLGYPILFVQPAPQVDLATPGRAERIVRVFLPVAWHCCVTDWTPHFTHRFAPTRTSEIPPATRISGLRSLLFLLRSALGLGLAFPFTLRRLAGRGCLGLRLACLARFVFGGLAFALLSFLPRTAIVGFVEARTLEDNRSATSEEAFELVLFAFGALGQRRVRKRLQFVELMAAGVATVIVSRHESSGRTLPVGAVGSL